MIRHLPHSGIDKAEWDRMLLHCPDRVWYAQSWVLDRCAPQWEALLGDDGSIMPLLWRSKYGMAYLYQPYAIQYQGVFSPVRSATTDAAFLAAIPERFRYWDIHMNTGMQLMPSQDLRITTNSTQELSLRSHVEALRAAYSKGHRRNLRTGADEPEVSDRVGIPEFIALFARTTGRRYRNIPVGGIELLGHLLSGAKERDELTLLGVRRGAELLAAACFISWEGRAILLKSANTEAGQERKAMFRIVDHFIAEHAGSGLLLDFAGSNTPSVIRFNEGFGARSRLYLHLVRNRLPVPYRWFKR
ncbi:MAG: GNAT family N-acetyltransferase [Flavobacteriales bacterium]|jgi:hypothetical protein|nr:GNAT family N-acetyltransferase [Flavobacteriales bacterium]